MQTLITTFAVLKAGRHYRLIYETEQGPPRIIVQWRNWFRRSWYSPEWIDQHAIPVGNNFPVQTILLARCEK